MFAYSDLLATENTWQWVNLTIVTDQLELQIAYITTGEREHYCRQVFWDKIRSIALAAGSEYLSSMVCGPVMPEVDTLEIASDIADAGASAIEYYVCCRWRVH